MDPNKQYTHLFFDMDGTVTRSRSRISDNMKYLMEHLTQDIVIISGARVAQIQHQTDNLDCYVLGQNGNHAVRGSEVYWEDRLNSLEIAEIEAHIKKLPISWEVPDPNDLIENRGSQTSFSIYGHTAPVEVKEAFDPDQSKRRAILRAVPLRSDKVDVKIAGTTCLDYFRKGCDKGHNVMRFIKHMGWNPDECIYFGDAIYPGGNDESVYGVIDTQGVSDQDETLTILSEHFADGGAQHFDSIQRA